MSDNEEWGYWGQSEGIFWWQGAISKSEAEDILAYNNSTFKCKRGPVQRKSDPNPFGVKATAAVAVAVAVGPLLVTPAERISAECDAVKAMLLEKNRKYGNSALEPQRIASKASPVEQLLVRIDDKLTRWKTSAPDEDEDVIKDLIGYLIMLRIARQK